MKSVLIPIQPKWCELIINGKKTIEVRKTIPKVDTPFKCYIYCTKDKWQHLVQMPDKSYRIYNGKEYGKYDKSLIFSGEANCKVIGEFVCDKIFPFSVYYDNPNCKLALREFPYVCLTDKQIIDYLGNGKEGYGWRISDLVIYDKPKELSEFRGKPCNAVLDIHESCTNCGKCGLKRPPQSWCYVEKLE